MTEPTFADCVAMGLAMRARELHGIGLNGWCRHCRPDTVWPCEVFIRAHWIIRRLETSGGIERSALSDTGHSGHKRAASGVRFQ